MAKVAGPLMSMDASGKLGDSIVFSKWKGRNTVRQFVIPANPMSSGQGDQRIMMGGTGRAVGQIAVSSDINAQLMTLNVIPSGQSKQSYLVKYIIDHYLKIEGGYAAELAAYAGHARKADFDAGAVELGNVDFDLPYASIAPFTGGFGLYLVARALIAVGFATSPYTVALADWSQANVEAFVDEFKAA